MRQPKKRKERGAFMLLMEQSCCREVLDCAGAPALLSGPGRSESGAAPPQSRTLTRDSSCLCSSWIEWARFSIGQQSAFTLIEILIAVTAFAIVLAAINTVFYSALRLRNTTTAALEDVLPVEHALGVIKRDLASIVLPGGTLSGTFQTTVSSNSVAGQTSPNFFTASGVIDETSPWAEVQRVSYLLLASTNDLVGKDLVRAVSRNLLPSLQEQSVQERLMSGVQSLTFLYHDGSQWKDSWDSTVENQSTGLSNSLPAAVKVQILMAPENGAVSRAMSREQPLELVVPIFVQARTNQTLEVAGGVQ